MPDIARQAEKRRRPGFRNSRRPQRARRIGGVFAAGGAGQAVGSVIAKEREYDKGEN